MPHQAVTDPVPHNGNRLGTWLGMIFHPFTVFIPALFVVLKDTNPAVAVGWVTFIAVIILVPALTLIHLARRQGRYTYQREMRHPLYLVFWVSMVVCGVGRSTGRSGAVGIFTAGVGGLGAAASGHQCPADEDLGAYGGGHGHPHCVVLDGRSAFTAPGRWGRGYCARHGLGARRDRPPFGSAGEPGDRGWGYFRLSDIYYPNAIRGGELLTHSVIPPQPPPLLSSRGRGEQSGEVPYA
jgi:hypothetical protein